MVTTASHFDSALLPPAKTFYSREFGSALGRERRGWAQTKCCFHDGQSKTSLSLNLDHGGFCCFSCGVKGGDIIAFVRLRDRCSFKTACQTLGAWRGHTSADERLETTRRVQEREWNHQRKSEQQNTQRQERLRLRDELHTAVRLYEKFASELHRIGQAEDRWAALSSLLDDLRMTESAYCRAAHLENPYE